MPGLCAGLCVSRTPVSQLGTWLNMALGLQGTRAGIPAVVLYSPNLLILKLELQKLLIYLF